MTSVWKTKLLQIWSCNCTALIDTLTILCLWYVWWWQKMVLVQTTLNTKNFRVLIVYANCLLYKKIFLFSRESARPFLEVFCLNTFITLNWLMRDNHNFRRSNSVDFLWWQSRKAGNESAQFWFGVCKKAVHLYLYMLRRIKD